MKRLNLIAVITIFFAAFFLFESCVPQRKMQMAKEEIVILEDSLRNLRVRYNALFESNEKLTKDAVSLNRDLKRMASDTADYGRRYRSIEGLNKRLNELYEQLLDKNKQLMENASQQRDLLTVELAKKQKELAEKEKALALREKEMADKQADVDKLKDEVRLRENRVRELESIVNRQDSMVSSLKKKVVDALLGYKDDELTVNIKDGKIYVSLSEELLFASGSKSVNSKGKKAIVKIANVLQKTEDVDIIIEGHTDSIPITNIAGMKDNWDLSVLRSTSIVRLLVDNGVSKQRVLAGGRGEFKPVATNKTADGRSLNRRIEIILSPNLDELFKVLEAPTK